MFKYVILTFRCDFHFFTFDCFSSFIKNLLSKYYLNIEEGINTTYSKMADRLTQLQDTINQVIEDNDKLMFTCIVNKFHIILRFQQAEHFCNSIGILQQFSTPSKFPGFDRSGSQTPQQQQNQEDYAVLFATLISRCAKDIDTLIESLPSEESSAELQVQSLRRLEAENKEAAEQLEEVCIFLLIC